MGMTPLCLAAADREDEDGGEEQAQNQMLEHG